MRCSDSVSQPHMSLRGLSGESTMSACVTDGPRHSDVGPELGKGCVESNDTSRQQDLTARSSFLECAVDAFGNVTALTVDGRPVVVLPYLEPVLAVHIHGCELFIDLKDRCLMLTLAAEPTPRAARLQSVPFDSRK